MTTLALDLGTRCGWAFGAKRRKTTAGVWDLKSDKTTRWRMLLFELNDWRDEIDEIVFEMVRRHVGTRASHVYGGLMATVELFCEENNITLHSVEVATIKKHATGKGNAKKEAMVLAAQERWPDLNVQSHDMADALWLLDYWRSKDGD